MTERVLITGGAGFIGSHLVDKLLALNYQVTVIDNFNDFYSPSAKRKNITEHLRHHNYAMIEGDIRDADVMRRAFEVGPFDVVVHLAAMAGVLPSLQNPSLYMDVNVCGTQRLLDLLSSKTEKPFLVLCSSSSVYGGRSGEQFLETDQVDRPLSPYAASKIAAEAAAYAAHSTRGLPIVCVRPFTVFGPRQRPDLAIHKFCHLIDAGQPLELFGDGSSRRDYTFVTDIVDGVYKAMNFREGSFEVFNLGRSEPVTLIDMVRCLEKALGKKAQIVHKPFQIGDVPYTYASIEKAKTLLGYSPKVSFEDGISQFVEWYKQTNSAVTSK